MYSEPSVSSTAAESMEISSNTIGDSVIYSIFTVSYIPAHVSAHQLYTSLKFYGLIEQLLQNPRRPDEFILATRQTDDYFKSPWMVKIDESTEVRVDWIFDDTNQPYSDCGDEFVRSYGDCEFDESWEPTEFIVPPNKRNASAIPEKSLVPFDHESPKHILNALNDDCLIAIFRSSSLALADLEALAGACTHFEWIVEPIIKSHKHRYADYYYMNQARSSPLWQIEAFLKEFGVSVKYIDLNNCRSHQVVLGMIIEHCPNIENIVYRINSQKNFDEMKPLFLRLRKLRLWIRHEFVDLSSLYDKHSRLEAFSLTKVDARPHDPLLPSIHLAKMKTFDLDCFPKINKLSVKEFIAKNPQLQDVVIHDDFGVFTADLPFFLETLPDLQTLRFTGSLTNDNDYFRFTRHNGKIEFFGIGRFTLSTVTATLRSLHRMQIPLNRVNIDCKFVIIDISNADGYMDFLDCICRLKSVTWLAVSILDNDGIAQIARNLYCLKHISVASGPITLAGVLNVLQTANALRGATFRTKRHNDYDSLVAIGDIQKTKNIVLDVRCDWHADGEYPIDIDIAEYRLRLENQRTPKQ